MWFRGVLTVLLLLSAGGAGADTVQAQPHGTFAFVIAVDLPGSPEAMFDALTGDISAWWDHSFSGDPVRLEIEPYPGGRFIEVMVRGAGEVHEAWPAVVERTWRHFIEDRFVDHVTAEKHQGD